MKGGRKSLLFFFRALSFMLVAPSACLFAQAQKPEKVFRFESLQETPVVKQGSRILPHAWAGGMNACHFAAIDLDGDGQDDYLAFDRIGARLRCFSSRWAWMPQAEDALPPVLSWVQTHDFDQDGRKDIFTFNGISGIALFRNLSEKDQEGVYRLRFQKVTDGLAAEMFGQVSPLYCTNEDYPVLADIDGDGDLDVLNFWVPSSGDFLLYYRNFAQEELSRSDTFLLRLEDWSWGCFVESEESNEIFLDSCSSRNASSALPFPGRLQSAGTSRPSGTLPSLARPHPAGAPRPAGLPQPKHAGSTLFAFRNPSSGLFDIVLGDVGYPDLFYLRNGGTAQNAHIIDYDTFFPYTQPVRLYNFPILSQIRYRDTLCYVYSPYETNPLVAEGYASLWRYRETGGGPLYAALAQKDFLQDGMLDAGAGAYPVAYDYDQDGRMDLVAGNYGQRVDAYYDYGNWCTRMRSSLMLYRNTGTEREPVFEWVTDDFLGLSKYDKRALFPAFADLDGDGRQEMVLGMEDGRLWLFRLEEAAPDQEASRGWGIASGRNPASVQETSFFQGPEVQRAVLLDSSYLDLALSGFSAPVLFDLNQDGRLDLIVGEKQHVWFEGRRRKTKGSLVYFENTGPGQDGLPVFVRRTDSLGGVDVIDRNFSNFGYSRPSFHKDREGKIILACGSENGEIFLYDSIEGNLDGTFRFMGKAGRETGAFSQETAGTMKVLDVGVHAAPLLYDWDDDGFAELIAGNQCGGLEYFGGTQWEITSGIDGMPFSGNDPGCASVYPNPFRSRIVVNIPAEGFFSISNLQGRKILQGKLSAGENALDLDILPQGLYLLHWQASPGLRSSYSGTGPYARTVKIVKL